MRSGSRRQWQSVACFMTFRSRYARCRSSRTLLLMLIRSDVVVVARGAVESGGKWGGKKKCLNSMANLRPPMIRCAASLKPRFQTLEGIMDQQTEQMLKRYIKTLSPLERELIFG